MDGSTSVKITQLASIMSDVGVAIASPIEEFGPKAVIAAIQGRRDRLRQVLLLALTSMMQRSPMVVLTELPEDDAIVDPFPECDSRPFFETRRGLLVRTSRDMDGLLSNEPRLRIEEPLLIRSYEMRGRSLYQAHRDLGPRGHVSLAIVAQLLVAQWDGQNGPLRTDGGTNGLFIGSTVIELVRSGTREQSRDPSKQKKWRMRAAHDWSRDIAEGMRILGRVVPPPYG